MGQAEEWLRKRGCESNGCAELMNEGDGNWLVRSSLNRDRTLRLSADELFQLADMIRHGGVPIPELVA